MGDELDVMEKKSLETGLSARTRKPSMETEWVFDLKDTKAQNEVRFIARLMAKGLSQEAVADYFDG